MQISNRDSVEDNEIISGEHTDTHNLDDKNEIRDGERQPLLPRRPDSSLRTSSSSRRCGLVSSALVTLALLGIILPLSLLSSRDSVPPVNTSVVRLLALSVWGSPASVGVKDKEERMEAIGEFIRSQSSSLDVVILQELWMRPDHARIESFLRDTELRMTAVGDLAPQACDGRVLPSFCSGLALITRLPVTETSFQSFSAHGDFWWNDGEYFARKGIGRVRVAPAPNITLDIFLTSLAANDYNAFYRQSQATELGEALRQYLGHADFVIAGGNLEVDPRSSESSYHDASQGLRDSRQEALGSGWLDPDKATYGNKRNSYSGKAGPLIYDYLLHKANGNYKMHVTSYDVPILKLKNGKSYSNHEAILAEYSLANL